MISSQRARLFHLKHIFIFKNDIIEFGRHNLNRFRKMGMLRNGVPSEATLCRIENGMDETALADRMQAFAQAYHNKLLKDSGMEIICVDGKAERGTVLENGCNPDIVRKHWSIESMHWGLDVNLLQDKIKRRSSKAARNLDTIHRIIYSVFSIWRRLRKKKADRRKGMAEIMRHISASFTKLINFLCQK